MGIRPPQVSMSVVSSDPLIAQSRPTGYVWESHPRAGYLAAQSVLTSGTLRMEAVYLQAGIPVTALDFVSSSTAAGTPLNQWAGLFSHGARTLLAVSTDKTTEAWTANTLKSFGVAYTPTVTGWYWAGLVVVATTVPTLMGVNSNVALNGLAPVLAGTSSTGRTAPESVGFVAGAVTTHAFGVWVGVKG